MRRPLVAANWKMNMHIKEARSFCARFLELCDNSEAAEAVICPPYTALEAVSTSLEGSDVNVGAQNFFPRDNGAYTGEISASMLLDLGCRYVIIGHSERRSLFVEKAETISEKVKVAVEAGLTPILCVGETMGERSLGQTERVVGQQLLTCLKLLSPDQLANVVIAYEPLWAIGSGRAATPADANRVAILMRERLKRMMYGDVDKLRILYGGSVSPENAALFAQASDLDGALVGGASLDPEKFASIVKAYGNEG